MLLLIFSLRELSQAGRSQPLDFDIGGIFCVPVMPVSVLMNAPVVPLNRNHACVGHAVDGETGSVTTTFPVCRVRTSERNRLLMLEIC